MWLVPWRIDGSVRKFALLFVCVFAISLTYFVFALPSISFEPPTLDDSSITGFNWVFVNVTSSEPLNQSLLEWVNSSATNNFSMLNSSSTNWFLNVSNLADGAYNYTIWAQNVTGDWNQTSRRFVVVDTTFPSIAFVYPTPDHGNTTSASWVYVNTTVSDLSNTTAFIDWNRTLVGWWRFNEGSGTGVLDLSSWGNNGTLKNGSAACANGDCPNWISNGKFGGALQFDGVNDYVNVGNFSSLQVNEITVTGWVYLKNVTVQSAFVSKGIPVGGTGYVFDYEPAYTPDRLYLWFGNGSSYDAQYWSKDLSADAWHFIAVSYNGSKGTFYVDSQNSTFTSTKGYVAGGASNLTIGSNSLNGILDDVRIFRRALSAEEISAAYNAGSYRLYHNFINLGKGVYDYVAFAEDSAGSVNQTEIRAVTVPFVIAVSSPLNQTYTKNWVWADVSLNMPGSWCGVSLNDDPNQTLNYSSTTAWYLNLSVPSEGSNKVNIYCNDTLGDMANSPPVYFTKDTTISGTPFNPSGNTDIYDDTIWPNKHYTAYGNITVYGGANLTLINTTLIFNILSDTTNYGINVNQNGKLAIKQRSNITATNDSARAYIYVDRGVMQAENSFFSSLGTVNSTGIYLGIYLNGLDSRSYFTNNSVSLINTIFNSWGENYSFIGNTFLNIPYEQCGLFAGTSGALGFYHYKNITLSNNTFRKMNNVAVDANIGSFFNIINNRVYDSSCVDTYVFNLWGSGYDGYVGGNYFNDTKRPIVFNTNMHNWLVENNVFENSPAISYTASIGLNLNVSGIVFRNNTVYSLPTSIAISIPNLISELSYNNTFENNTFNKVGTGIDYRGGNSTFRNNIFTADTAIATTYGTRLTISTSGELFAKTNLFENMSLDGFDYGLWLDSAASNLFLDLNVSNSSLYDLYLIKNNSNNKFVNILLNSSKIYFNTTDDIFNPYYYADIVVQDSNSQFLSDMALMVTNEINYSYPSINRGGVSKASFTTTSNGHTPMPLQNNGDTVVLMAYWRTNLAQQNMTYSISAYDPNNVWTNITHTVYPNGAILQLQPLAQVTNVTPDEYWYRSNPNAYQNTTVLQINYTLTNISVNANQKETNITVTRWNTSLPQGQVLVNFTAESVNGNNVNFTVCSLTASASYAVKNDGSAFATKQADSQGCIWFNNSVWTFHVFTVEEQSQGPSGCSAINAATYNASTNTITLNNQTSTLCTLYYDVNNQSAVSYELLTDTYTLNANNMTIYGDATLVIANTSLTLNASYDNQVMVTVGKLWSGNGTLIVENSTIGSVNSTLRASILATKQTGTDGPIFITNSRINSIYQITSTSFNPIGALIKINNSILNNTHKIDTPYVISNSIIQNSDADNNGGAMYGYAFNVTMRNNLNPQSFGIHYAHEVAYSSVYDLNITNTNIAIYAKEQSYPGYFRNNLVWNIVGGGHGLDVQLSNDNTYLDATPFIIANNTVFNVSGNGITVAGRPFANVLSNNVTYSGTGLYVWGVEEGGYAFKNNLTSKNNQYTNNTKGIVYVGDSWPNVTILSINDDFSGSTQYDLQLGGTIYTPKFINAKYNLSKTSLTGRLYDYKYLDVKVVATYGDLINNALVYITNLNDPGYPSIDMTGANKTSVATGISGHTMLPDENESNSIAVLAFWKNSTHQQNMSYAISAYDPFSIWTNITHTVYPNGTIQQLQPLAQVTGVNPDSSWYRPDPNVPTHTINLTINYSRTNLSVNANQNETNITVTKWNTSLPQGQILVNFTAESVNGNNVNFTVCSLTASASYAVKNDGSAFATKTADSSGCIWFNNSVWTFHVFTVEEQSQGPSGCSAINAATYNVTSNTITLKNQTSTLCTIFYDINNASALSYNSVSNTYVLNANLYGYGFGIPAVTNNLIISNATLIINNSYYNQYQIKLRDNLTIENMTIMGANSSATWKLWLSSGWGDTSAFNAHINNSIFIGGQIRIQPATSDPNYYPSSISNSLFRDFTITDISYDYALTLWLNGDDNATIYNVTFKNITINGSSNPGPAILKFNECSGCTVDKVYFNSTFLYPPTNNGIIYFYGMSPAAPLISNFNITNYNEAGLGGKEFGNIKYRHGTITNGGAGSAAINTYRAYNAIYWHKAKYWFWDINIDGADLAITNNGYDDYDLIDIYNVKISNVGTAYTLWGDNTTFYATNVKLTNYSTFSKFWGTSRILTYELADIRVIDVNENPVNGAKVTFFNNISDGSPHIVNRIMPGGNAIGEVGYGVGLEELNTTFTLANGHTPRPDENSKYTVALLRHTQTNANSTYYSYALSAYDPNNIWTNVTHTIYPNGTIQQLQPLAQATNVTPDESWYRSDPNTHQNTTTLQINYIKTSMTLAVTNLTNLTVSEYSPSRINFSAVNSTSGQRMNLTVSNGTFPVLNGYPYTVRKDGVVQSTRIASADKVVFTNIDVGSDYLIELFTNLTVSLNSPPNNWLTNNPQVVFNCSAFSNNSLVNITLYGNFPGVFAQNGTVNVSGAVNSTTFIRILSDGSYLWNCLALDTTGAVFAPTNHTFTIDTLPPGLITNPLNQSQSTDWIFWNWTNPILDFGHVEVYLNGTWKANTSNSFYNATGLNASTWYVLQIRTVDAAGNVNGTWVNSSARTLDDNTPPTVAIIRPENTTYNYNMSLPLNFSVSEPASWCGYSLDGAPNVTLQSCLNTTFNVSGSGPHSIRVYANDTSGNMNSSIVYFAMDLLAPVLANVSSNSLTSASAVIVWDTDEPSDSTVYYGTTSPSLNASNSTLTQHHSLPLPGLSASTQYYYNVSSCDAVGNCNVSTQFSFYTSAAPTTPPGSPPSGGSQPAVVSSGTRSVVVNSPLVRVVVSLRSELSNPSLVVTIPPAVPVSFQSGLVYHYLNVTKINFNNSDIANASIEFRVNKSWLNAESITQVYLARYSNGWTKLDTRLVNSTSAQNTYRAYTNGFSYFAIVGEQAVSLQADVPPVVNVTPVVLVPNQSNPTPVLVTNRDIVALTEYLNSVVPQTEKAKQILNEARLKIGDAQSAFDRGEQRLAKDLLANAQTLINEASGLRPAMVEKSWMYSLLLVFVAVLLGAYAYSSRPRK